MEYALVALAAFAIGFIVRGRLEKTEPPKVTPKSGGGPGEENDQPGP
jgi:hypothetical protein